MGVDELVDGIVGDIVLSSFATFALGSRTLAPCHSCAVRWRCITTIPRNLHQVSAALGAARASIAALTRRHDGPQLYLFLRQPHSEARNPFSERPHSTLW